ncbi:MAG: phosphatase PAP2 family protein [Pseudomonadota bacterium]
MLNAIQEQLSPAMVDALAMLTDWGGPIGWIFALQLLCWLGGLRTGLLLAIGAVLTLLLNSWLKWLFVAPRPYFLDAALTVHRPTGGFGMPSGHAQGAAVVWIGIAALQRPGRRWVLLLAVLAVLVALSRWLLGVHSMAQVLVGFALGLLSIALLLRARPWLSRVSRGLSPAALLLLGALAVPLVLAVTAAVLALRADFVVPAQWQANAVARGAEAAAFSAQNMLSASTGYASAAALLGLLVTLAAAQRRPLATPRGWGRLLVLVVGIALTAGYWALGARLDRSGAQALLLPLCYPLCCMYLPLWLTARLRPAPHADKESHVC